MSQVARLLTATRMQCVNLNGMPWCPQDTSIQPPRIFGLLSRRDAECIGVVVGVQARQEAPGRNSWFVETDPDSITIARLPYEPLYALDGPSLVLRAAELVGTGRSWAYLYEP